MRKNNSLKTSLSNGHPIIGTWSVLPSPSVAEVIAGAGFDFIIIDMEHGPSSFETAENIIRACEVTDCAPLLRVPQNDESLILRGLEVGSHGIVVPAIGSREEAKRAVESIKYFPEGHRGLSPFTRSAGYSAANAKNMTAEENQNNLSVLLVEGIKGIEDLDNILTVEGIDVIYLGTYDLSQSIGLPGQTNHVEVLKHLENCARKIRDKGKAVGCLAQSQKDVSRWLDLGIQFIPYQADCALLGSTCQAISREFKKKVLK
jgi:4-hydroxy-2-oxoheptanedioate aldolase